MPPSRANGKICYIEIPALDVQRSAAFYAKVVGWTIRQRGDGHTAFELHARVENLSAIAFYETAGWTVTERLIHTVEHGIGYDERVLIKHRA